jgi:hypothetical protein
MPHVAVNGSVVGHNVAAGKQGKEQLPCPHDSIPIARSIGNNRGDADAPGDSPFDDGRRKMQS